MSNISVLIVEDEVIVAMDIARRIKKLGYDVAGIKHSSEQAINYIDIHRPDVILCDINIFGDQDGIDVAEYVKNNTSIPLIFLTALSDRGTLDRAKKTLPYGYIVKPFNNRDLLSAIELAMYKHSTELEKLSLTQKRINQITSTEISEREFQILQDIIKGMTNSQISEQRHVSISTVKYHITNILEKMDVKNRAGALHKIIEMLT